MGFALRHFEERKFKTPMNTDRSSLDGAIFLLKIY